MDATPPRKKKLNGNVEADKDGEGGVGVLIQGSPTGSGDASVSASSVSLDDLQPEILEMIFSNLCDDTRNANNTLLKCREVNQRWKSIVNGMLERVCRLNFSTVQSSYQLEKPVRRPLIPEIGTSQRTFGRPFACNLAVSYCPRYIVSQGRRQSSNPFPSKSLAIRCINWRRMEEGAIYQNYSASTFMSNFGYHLKYLTLGTADGLTFSVADFLYILIRAPNVTGLMMDGVRVILNTSTRRQSLSLPALPHLVSLKIRKNEPEPAPEFGGLTFTSWLLKAYSKQLECLEVDSFNDPLTATSFPKLKEIKIGNLSASTLSSSEAIPLRRLIIVDQLQINSFSFIQFASFIQNFSATLEHLEISLEALEDKKKYLGMVSGKASVNRLGSSGIFPKLKVFGIRWAIEDDDLVLIKQFFLPKFPKLEVIELLDPISQSMLKRCVYCGVKHDHKREAVEPFLVKERYWEVCSKLVTVRIVPKHYGLYMFRVQDMIEIVG